ncbi:MAG: hypothetical protein LBF41_07665 [Deltaproteobacteria bacterium]|jgi:hypothetical protein|nr:hypothetical protein [Deltaproteobacteria bacterium]
MNNIKLFYASLNKEGKSAKAGEIRANLEETGVKEQHITNPRVLTPGKVTLVSGDKAPGEDLDPQVFSYYLRENDEKVPRILLAKHHPVGMDPKNPGEPAARFVVFKPVSETSDWIAANADGQANDFGYAWPGITNLRGVAQLNASHIFLLGLDGTKIYHVSTSALDSGSADSPEVLIDLAETLPEVTGFVPKGVRLIALEDHLFVLHAYVADPYDPAKGYADGKITRIPVNFSGDGPPEAGTPEVLDVGKNPSGLAAVLDGKFVKLFVPCVGGNLAPGSANGPDSKLLVVDFKKKTVATAYAGVAGEAGKDLDAATVRLNFYGVALNQSGSGLYLLNLARDKKGTGFFWRLYKTTASNVLAVADKTIDDLETDAKLLDHTPENPDKAGDPGILWNIIYENASQRLWFLRGDAVQVTEGASYPPAPGDKPSNASDRRYLTAGKLYGTDAAILVSADLAGETLYGSSRRQAQASNIVFTKDAAHHPVPAVGAEAIATADNA